MTNKPPATAPVMRLPTGCIMSEPAQTATRPARAPLCTKPGSFLPAIKAATMPPTIAMREFIATRPEAAFNEPAVITLKPNQPTQSNHEPRASHGIDEGGMPIVWPVFE